MSQQPCTDHLLLVARNDLAKRLIVSVLVPNSVLRDADPGPYPGTVNGGDRQPPGEEFPPIHTPPSASNPFSPLKRRTLVPDQQSAHDSTVWKLMQEVAAMKRVLQGEMDARRGLERASARGEEALRAATYVQSRIEALERQLDSRDTRVSDVAAGTEMMHSKLGKLSEHVDRALRGLAAEESSRKSQDQAIAEMAEATRQSLLSELQQLRQSVAGATAQFQRVGAQSEDTLRKQSEFAMSVQHKLDAVGDLSSRLRRMEEYVTSKNIDASLADLRRRVDETRGIVQKETSLLESRLREVMDGIADQASTIQSDMLKMRKLVEDTERNWQETIVAHVRSITRSIEQTKEDHQLQINDLHALLSSEASKRQKAIDGCAQVLDESILNITTQVNDIRDSVTEALQRLSREAIDKTVALATEVNSLKAKHDRHEEDMTSLSRSWTQHRATQSAALKSLEDAITEQKRLTGEAKQEIRAYVDCSVSDVRRSVNATKDEFAAMLHSKAKEVELTTSAERSRLLTDLETRMIESITALKSELEGKLATDAQAQQTRLLQLEGQLERNIEQVRVAWRQEHTDLSSSLSKAVTSEQVARTSALEAMSEALQQLRQDQLSAQKELDAKLEASHISYQSKFADLSQQFEALQTAWASEQSSITQSLQAAQQELNTIGVGLLDLEQRQSQALQAHVQEAKQHLVGLEARITTEAAAQEQRVAVVQAKCSAEVKELATQLSENAQHLESTVQMSNEEQQTRLSRQVSDLRKHFDTQMQERSPDQKIQSLEAQLELLTKALKDQNDVLRTLMSSTRTQLTREMEVSGKVLQSAIGMLEARAFEKERLNDQRLMALQQSLDQLHARVNRADNINGQTYTGLGESTAPDISELSSLASLPDSSAPLAAAASTDGAKGTEIISGEGATDAVSEATTQPVGQPEAQSEGADSANPQPPEWTFGDEQEANNQPAQD